MKGLLLFSSFAYGVLASPCKPSKHLSATVSGSLSALPTASASLSSIPSSVSATSASASASPTVDLGYEIHAGTLNETGNYYTFSNIPYAQQPVGEYRFNKPVAISGTSSDINDGSTTGTECMQAYPEWILELQAAAYGVDTATVAAILYAQAAQTESCLLLDVYVPVDVFENGLEAPVLFWIHGGGFTYGSKTGSGDPAGLIARSKLDGSDGVIVVSINYRLGLFGWLAGEGVTANLGLFDQRMALEWAQTYISRFGGSSEKVTVMGESAGAASILHHITSYGGAEDVPFQAAIPQSPAFEFIVGNATNTSSAQVSSISTNFDAFVNALETFEDSAISAALKYINQAVVVQASAGRFNYGPVVDGDYVPEHPQVLLAQGSFDTSLTVMNSHTSNESVPFVPTTIATEGDVRSYIESALSAASSDTIDYILTTLYPAVFDGTHSYWSEFGRAVQMNTDFYFACSSNFLAKAYNAETHNYIFAYPPGYHAEDVSYVFFNGDTTTLDDGLPVNATLAYYLQDYIVQFAKTFDPNSDSLPEFPAYGSEGHVLAFTGAGLVVEVDDMKNERCDWIQKAMVDGLLS
ncbi:Alpha/Beta hydrolase protein [Truncatella angustata]|uniref:Carboxylic ester hydrolase n=1 Tax=Truncatella angustata TaxID=152316 RepID=A0A9P8UKW3_9PEZI|nr:Alpha/Beta hydrolase protein [Truncatella angustata]KAH6653956.1 Alpha/Beta hydrolase protein [Truncatella angustata]